MRFGGFGSEWNKMTEWTKLMKFVHSRFITRQWQAAH